MRGLRKLLAPLYNEIDRTRHISIFCGRSQIKENHIRCASHHNLNIDRLNMIITLANGYFYYRLLWLQQIVTNNNTLELMRYSLVRQSEHTMQPEGSKNP